jgi:hypothetical protein
MQLRLPIAFRAATDVSTGEPVIWDFGSIAMNGRAAERALFQYGYKCAQAGRLWTASRSVGSEEANDDGTGQSNQYPDGNEFIGRLAAR